MDWAGSVVRGMVGWRHEEIIGNGGRKDYE